MAALNNVLAFVMAGGEGSRLRPLTAKHCKPAVPFNARHRIVDFVLSNLANSGIHSTYMLVQYKSQSLIEHVHQSWSVTGTGPQNRVTVVPPRAGQVFLGTADAVYQNIDLIKRLRPSVVAVFGADHIYRMDVRQMIDFHHRNQADVTVAALPVPLAECRQFGIVDIDGTDGKNDMQRIVDFKEKPESAQPMRGSTTHALASMGNYLFKTEVLLEALEKAHASGATDFGKDILPAMVATHRLAAYDFHTNVVPGMAAHEEHGYWRDVGTLDAYFQAQLDTLGDKPRFGMDNPLWPIHTGADADADDAVAVEDGKIHRSVVGAGSVVDGASLDQVMVRSAVRIERGAKLDRCIVMDRSRIGLGAQVRRAIIDQDNDVPAHERIGFDLEKDRARFPVTESGIVVVPAGFFPPRAKAAAFLMPACVLAKPSRIGMAA